MNNLIEEFDHRWSERQAEYQSLDWQEQLTTDIDDRECVANAESFWEDKVKELEPTATLVELHTNSVIKQHHLNRLVRRPTVKLLVTKGDTLRDVIHVHDCNSEKISSYDRSMAWTFAYLRLGSNDKPTVKEIL